MLLPELLKTTHKGKSFDLVAFTNGKHYSVKLKDNEWKHQEGPGRKRYRLPRKYVPHHLKNLKRGCKLFLESHFPGFKKDPVVISGEPLLELPNIKTQQDDSKNAQDRGNLSREGSQQQEALSYN